MIIESAFFKLPELLLSKSSTRNYVEAMIVQDLAKAIIMELNCRNIPFPYKKVNVEVDYPCNVKSGKKLRADLQFNSEGVDPLDTLENYGFKTHQWVEAKTFFAKKNQGDKTNNLGRIINDILRLLILPEEYQGGIRHNSRYLLLIFNNLPKIYLPSNREWLSDLFTNSTGQISINLNKEVNTLINKIFSAKNVECSIIINYQSYSWIPIYKISNGYYGYLFRIDKFQLTLNDKSIIYNPNSTWTAKEDVQMNSLRNLFLNLRKADWP